MKNQFSGTFPNPPEMGLRAQLGWEYFFGEDHPGWACVQTDDGAWIVTDENCDLDTAMLHPDDETFIEWLEDVVTEHLEADPVAFLSTFTSIPGLITPAVAEAMVQAIKSDVHNTGA